MNIAELINAGVSFTIEDERTERCFSEDGELRGVVCEFDDYVVYEFDGDDTPLCDIDELRDTDDRWGHVADSHVRDKALTKARYMHLDVVNRDYREYGHLATWRKRRFEALSRYAMRCVSPAKLKRMQKEVWRRYRESCAACAINGTWWAIYLTKQQANDLYDLIGTRM
jgi:hypothetical protein